jgi:hypothetical protein
MAAAVLLVGRAQLVGRGRHSFVGGCGVLRVVAVAATALGGACDSPTEPQALIPDVRHAVVGSAADALDARGQFRLPPVETSGSTPVISIEHAGAVAVGYVGTFITNPNVITPSGFISRSVSE